MGGGGGGGEGGDAAAVEKGRLVEEEERAEGGVTVAVYLTYFKNSGSVAYVAFVFVCYMLSQVRRPRRRVCPCLAWFSHVPPQSMMTGSDLWLSYWSSHPDGALGYYLGVYASWSLANAVAMLLKGAVYAGGAARSSRKLHTDLITRIAYAPVRYFDTTPTVCVCVCLWARARVCVSLCVCVCVCLCLCIYICGCGCGCVWLWLSVCVCTRVSWWWWWWWWFWWWWWWW